MSTTKAKLAQEFLETRAALNELRRKEKLLRDYFIEDLAKFDKTAKSYGGIEVALYVQEREKVDLDTLHLNYPEIYDQLLATYEVVTMKLREKK